MKKIKKIIICTTSYIRIMFKDWFEKKPNINPENSIVLLNTELDSDNLGDKIIMQHCREVLADIFPEKKFYEIATHTYPTQGDMNMMMNASAVIVCGTNFIRSKKEIFDVWKFTDKMRWIPNFVLLGVGKGEYGRFSPYTKVFWRHILNNSFLHSVRDEYTLKQLQSIGINNVINTSCVTLWGGIDKICKFIPEHKSANVIFTVTGYYNYIQHDTKLLEILQRNYKTLYFWPQGLTDLKYLQSNFDIHNINILERSLEAYEKCLNMPYIDYVGSRLHGGIHALYHKKRTIILAVDNRAREINRDTNIPVVQMASIGDVLEDKIQSNWKTKIHINNEVIEQWKNNLKLNYERLNSVNKSDF